MEPSWAPLGAVLGPLGAVLGPSEGAQAGPKTVPRRARTQPYGIMLGWGRHGALLYWGLLEPSWAPLGTVLGHLLRPSWGSHGALQRPPKGSHRKTPRGAPSLGCQVGAPQVDSPKGGPRGPKEGPKIGQEGPQVSPSLGGPLGRGGGPSAAPAGSSGGLLCGSPSASCVLPLLTTPLLPCIPIHSAEFGNTSDSPPVPGQTTLSGSSTRQIPDFTRQMEPRKMRRKRERRRTEEEDHLHVRPQNRRGHFERIRKATQQFPKTA